MSDVFDDLFNDAAVEAAAAAANRIGEVVERMTRARATYYNTNDGSDPLVISDAEYDALEDELRTLDPNHALLKAIGQPIPASSGWDKVRHEAPMGSLNKAQTKEDFKAWWVANIEPLVSDGKAKAVWSDKCDGISLSNKYVADHETRALTRGDGEIGEDITRNVKLMKGRVPTLKGLGDAHIRGEVVLFKSDWRTYLPNMSNPRNAASGIAKRQSDSSDCKHLTVLHYQIARVGGTPITHKEVEFKALQAYGFAVPSWGTVNTFDEAWAVYTAFIDGKREALDYEIDGLVFEVNSLEVADQLGLKNHRPAGAIALKFPHEKKPSKLRNITWQVGKSGRVTPVANFDPVRLVGANVSNASLHNVSNIVRLVNWGKTPKPTDVAAFTFRAGSEIMVSRRNDVIPYVESMITQGKGKLLLIPDKCPECELPLSVQGEYLMCTNSSACPAQVAGLIQRWVEKIGLKGWGSTIIEALVAQEIVAEPADLYKLDPAELALVELDGRKIGSTAHTIMKELLGKGIELPLHVFVGSLGIPLVARSMCKTIVDAGFDTLPKMRDATWQDIAAIDRMGDGKAKSFVAGLLLRAEVIDNLISVGVDIKPPSDGPMKGKTICMTGFRDPSMVARIEDTGGTVKSSVGKTLTILVANDPTSGSGKAKKARGYGVEIISPDEMWTRLGGRA